MYLCLHACGWDWVRERVSKQERECISTLGNMLRGLYESWENPTQWNIHTHKVIASRWLLTHVLLKQNSTSYNIFRTRYLFNPHQILKILLLKFKLYLTQTKCNYILKLREHTFPPLQQYMLLHRLGDIIHGWLDLWIDPFASLWFQMLLTRMLKPSC